MNFVKILYPTHPPINYNFLNIVFKFFIFAPFFTVCTRFSNGVASMLGAVSSNAFDTLYSYSNTFHVPFVTPWFPEKVLNATTEDYAITLWPDYHKAIIDMVVRYEWDKVIYIYDSHDGKCVQNLNSNPRRNRSSWK